MGKSNVSYCTFAIFTDHSMMSDNTIQLSFDHFETNAANTFRQMWNDQHFADVTLVTVDDQHIRAHKVILREGLKKIKKLAFDQLTGPPLPPSWHSTGEEDGMAAM